MTEEPWAFDAESNDITLHGAPVFKVYREWCFPCIEDEDRFEADLEYLAHAGVVCLLLNDIARRSDEITAADRVRDAYYEGWWAGLQKARNDTSTGLKPDHDWQTSEAITAGIPAREDSADITPDHQKILPDGKSA